MFSFFLFYSEAWQLEQQPGRRRTCRLHGHKEAQEEVKEREEVEQRQEVERALDPDQQWRCAHNTHTR